MLPQGVRSGKPKTGPVPGRAGNNSTVGKGLRWGLLVAAWGQLAAIGPVVAAGPLAPAFTAEYGVEASGFPVGRMSRTLSYPSAGTYRFSSSSEARGLARLFRNEQVTETSTGRVQDGRLRPDEYRYVRSGGKKPKAITLSFDWAASQLANQVNGETWKLDLVDQAVDRLVYQVLVMSDLASGTDAPSYVIADGGKLKPYRFKKAGEERLKLGVGEYATLRLEREHDQDDRSTRIWLAPELNFIPVRVELVDDGNTTQVELNKVEFQP